MQGNQHTARWVAAHERLQLQPAAHTPGSISSVKQRTVTLPPCCDGGIAAEGRAVRMCAAQPQASHHPQACEGQAAVSSGVARPWWDVTKTLQLEEGHTRTSGCRAVLSRQSASSRVQLVTSDPS